MPGKWSIYRISAGNLYRTETQKKKKKQNLLGFRSYNTSFSVTYWRRRCRFRHHDAGSTSNPFLRSPPPFFSSLTQTIKRFFLLSFFCCAFFYFCLVIIIIIIFFFVGNVPDNQREHWVNLSNALSLFMRGGFMGGTDA